MASYLNFDIALYFNTRCIAGIDTLERFEKDFAFFEKHLKVSKVYLETHRDDMDVTRDKLLLLKKFFEDRGIKVSGAITTTFMKTIKNKQLIDETGIFGCGGTILGESARAVRPEKGSKRAWATICYTDEAQRRRLKEISEFTASIFDEIILDDFYFTNCTCPSCIEAKGGKSWEQFRLELMTEVSENIVIKPAKAVNPGVNYIIKYPNWYESYQYTGYNTETQPLLFDEVYTGTETRDTDHGPQHLPRYGSYSIVRWFENVKPGKCGGGWIDQWHSIQNLAYWLEQAFLTYFAKGRELTLFCYSWLVDTVYIPPLGHELEHLDAVIGLTGKPVGIPVYEPHHAHGENHLYDYLGMAGLAFEPQPSFPEADSLIFLTANSARDDEVLGKMKAHLLRGGDVCITSGFLKAMQDKGIEAFTSAVCTGGKVYARDYFTGGAGSVFNGEYYGRDNVLLPVIGYMNNAADCLIGLKKHDNNFPVLLRNLYGKGTVYTLVIPDDYADIYKFPTEVLTTIRQYLMNDLGVYAECAAKVGTFLYDNNTFILQSFQDRANRIKVHVCGGGRRLVDLKTGEEIPAYLRRESESIFEISITPVLYRILKII
jgi:hypothetical protein